MLELGYVDSIQAYLGNVILGEGTGVLKHAAASTLAEAPRWCRHSVKVLGDDVLIEYQRKG